MAETEVTEEATEEAPAPDAPEAEPVEVIPEPREVALNPDDIQVRSVTKRELDVRLLPWDMQIETTAGPEMRATLGVSTTSMLFC